jgi:hypothetical protein
VVIVRFGHDADPICMQMDEVLASVADPIKNFAVIYLVDITAVSALLYAAFMLPALHCVTLGERTAHWNIPGF